MEKTRFSRSRGFTLVEVLIGTTLLALMMSLLMSSLFSIGRATRAGEARFDGLDNDRLVQAFLREQIAGAVPLTLRAGPVEHVLFEGGPNEILFVGHLPAHRGGGGLQHLHIGSEATFESAALVLRYRNAWTDLPFAAPDGTEEWQSTGLVAELGSVRFRFFGREDDESPLRWTDRWAERDRLPALIKVEVELSDGRPWPPLAIFVRAPTAVGQPQLFRTAAEQ